MVSDKQAKSRTEYPGLKMDFTSEERANNGRQGGIASGKAKKRQKTFRDSVKAIMECRPLSEDQCDLLAEMGLEPTMLNQIQVAVFDKASRGDVEAARYLRDTAGEKPREGLELGNLDDKPLASLDMSKLTDEQLRIIAARRSEATELD